MSTSGQTTDGARDRRILRTHRGVRSAGTASPNGATSERIPLPPRERRPALAALAVLLIVGGAAIAGLLALRADDRQTVVVLREAVEAGQPITADLLTTTKASVEGLPVVPADQEATLVGQFAATALPAGTLLMPDMLSANGLLQDGKAAVGLALRAGLLPASGVQGGDVVDIVAVPGSGAAPLPDDATGGSTLVFEARVSSARVDDSSGTTLATVIVDRNDAALVARAGAGGGVALVLIERGVALDASAGDGSGDSDDSTDSGDSSDSG